MQLQKIIQFKKKRELGEIITDTFKFLRRNFKPLFKVLLKTCLVPFIIVLAAIAFYTYETAGFNLVDTDSVLDSPFTLFASVLLFAFAAIYFSAMLNGSVSTFIKYYDINEGVVDVDQVAKEINGKTGQFISLGFLQAIYIGGIAFIMALLFGLLVFSGGANPFLIILLVLVVAFLTIYLSVRYSLVFPIFVHKSTSVAQTFSRSSTYVKDHWWITFFTILIMGFIVGIIGSLFSFPAAIYMGIKTFTSVQEGTLSDPKSLMDPIMIALQVFGSAVQYFLYIIPAITINLVAFNLNEHKNQTGTLEQIDKLGS